ncbi:hypothetical protein Moror_578 [Moniliophthora roreri MCA 2997]|uniref:Uncharacterized protein n=2 Tax=Moniliophthora roreri TaxID=221103 RepID=V2WW36_MONRO|nr:hypothetical protein Moror_578 [Moniliophthora roreri MCA 2997]KAI3598083.1 hypothetical protein WG66_009097 [Moniliophthora roreri]
MPPHFTPNSTWIPAEGEEGQPSISLLLERSWLIGTILTGVGYGIVVTLTVLCIGPLLKGLKGRKRDYFRLFSVIYVTLLFLCATMFMAGDSSMAQYSYVDYRLYPGGPAAFENDMFWIPVSEIGNVGFVVSNWLADLVVVWRCLVVFKGSSFPFWAICIYPCIAYIVSWVFGLLWLIQISATSPWVAEFNFTLYYFWSSFVLNVTMTIAIVARLMVYRYRIAKVMGNKHGRQYTSIASMIIESSLLYTSFQLVFIITFALNNPIQPLFLQPLSQVQCISPLLIIFRVTCGHAWTSTTSTQIFKSHPTHELRYVKGSQPSGYNSQKSNNSFTKDSPPDDFSVGQSETMLSSSTRG